MGRQIYLSLTILAALGAGVVGGIWFAFSNFVMTALSRVAPGEGAAAMQAINVYVLNRFFFLAFFGTAAVGLAAAAIALFQWSEPGALLVVAAGVLYVVGCIGVTIAGNVPLNSELAAADARSVAGAAIWARYVRDWVYWNTVRAVATIAAATLFTMALALN